MNAIQGGNFQLKSLNAQRQKISFKSDPKQETQKNNQPETPQQIIEKKDKQLDVAAIIIAKQAQELESLKQINQNPNKKLDLQA